MGLSTARELPREEVYNPLLITATLPVIMTDTCCLMRCEGGKGGGRRGRQVGTGVVGKITGRGGRDGSQGGINLRECECERRGKSWRTCKREE